MKSMHPSKRYWAETNINKTTKTKLKKGHNSVKILQMIWLIVFGFTDTSTLVGHFVLSPREREKRNTRDSRGDGREGQDRKREMKEVKEQKE